MPSAHRKRMLMPIEAHTRALAIGLASGLALSALGCSGSRKDIPKQPGPPTEAGTAASRATPDGRPVMDGDHSIIRQEAVGPLRVGEWRRPAMSFVYAISARTGRDSEEIVVVRGIGKDTVTLTFDNDTLRRVFVTHTGPHTVDGFGVGTPFATVAGQPGAKTSTRGTAQVATINRMCGVEFATDSAALSPDSLARNPAPKPSLRSATIRAISVGYCQH